ncbi:hypothetical protein FS595_09030 [Serratia rubidaea]|uniref:KAP family P-loop NTPase fold protein n=1 Tax=Serratia rubidaea TaxID=61652 RepID=UPI001F23B419|nr:P-loop NTPase fold protein [Serratia rubidaea]UJD79833.1 hypothetical protein FS596_09030 [Serratia rubidaea]UJD84389.1 hypothetical protein FS595_09030 [Serratia rubidaea]
MRVTGPVINLSEGFSQNNDIFSRKPLFDLIMRFVKKSPDNGLVLAIDDKWGNGKTTFLKMMHSEINNDENSDINVIYYDAFENDYHTDPFVSLASEIYQSLDEGKTKFEKVKKSFVETGKKVGANLLKGGVNYAVTTLTGGLVSGNALDSAKDKITSSISEPLEKYVEEKLITGKSEKGDLKNFKEVMEKIYNDGGKKTLFIIDELDRARPDFSLDLLEKIKHIFSVEGFVFLLAVNREQFEKSIERRYGSIDSKTYLNKFVHYWFTLPKINTLSPKCSNRYTRSTMSIQLSQLDRGTNIISRNGGIELTLAYLLDINGCSLREAERCYSLIASIDNCTAINNFSSYTYHALMALVSFLKVTNNKLLNDIRYKVISKEIAIDKLGITEDRVMTQMDAGQIVHILDYHYASEEELNKAREGKLFSDIEHFHYGSARRELFDEMSDIIDFLHIGN